MTYSTPNVSSSNATSSSYAAVVAALNALRSANGEEPKYYPPNYQGIISAILDLKKWGQAGAGDIPPSWFPTADNDGNITGGNFNPQPQNGTLWFDERQGKLFVWVDDGFYQTNGGDGIPSFSADPPDIEVPGALWYNTNTGTLYIWDGTTWVGLTSQTGFTTATLQLANATTTEFSSYGNIVSPSTAQTQEDYNTWLYNAVLELETEIESTTSAEPLDMGSDLPASGTDGDFFYKTGNNTLYVWNDGSWHKAVPNQNLNNNQNIIDLRDADVAIEAEVDALEVDVAAAQSDITALQAQPHHTYTIGTATGQSQGDGFTPGIWLVDEAGTATGVNISGAGSIAIAEGQYGITIGAASIESALSAIQSDYLTSVDKTELETSIASDEERITAVEDTQASLLTSLSAVSTAVGDLPSLAEVQARLSAAGGSMTGAIDMGSNAVSNLPAPALASDAVRKDYVDGIDSSIRANYIAKTDGILESVLINNSNSDKAALDFSGSSFYAQDAFKFKSFDPAGSNSYVSFGTSDKPWEYSWEYAGSEAFNYVYNGERVFAIQGDNAYAKDLVLCNLTANAAGPLYTNPISVRTKLTDLETATTALTNQISQLAFDANTKNIYYGDTAPTNNLEDGDVWFDSHNLRLNIRHGGFWVFPDRVEDVALKSALYNAINTSTDYNSLKANLLAALN